MSDPRIPVYRSAALKMVEGDFQVELPLGADTDEVAQLGEALQSLGHTLEKKFQEIRQLATVTEKVNAGLVLDDVLDHVYQSFRSIIPYDRIGFSLLNSDGAQVCARWARSEAPEMKITAGYEAPLAGSSLEQIIETGLPRILNDLEAYLVDHPGSESTRLIVEEGMRSSLTCPLMAMGKPVGFMFFSSMTPHTYQHAHVELFLQIAGQLAVIVEKGRLYQHLLEFDELKSKFLGMAAHDLRSPLGVVSGLLQLLMKGKLGQLTDSQLRLMQRMDASCSSMLGLIEELLDISAIESGHLHLELEKVDLLDYLQQCHACDQFVAADKSMTLKADLPAALPQVMLDRNRMDQVLNNLISNAIKFSHPDTTITISATEQGEEVVVSVTDQGQGIPDEQLPKVFTEFGRVSVRPTADESSTGLGLAIVKRIVEAHGGRIWVDSRHGVGSSFSFALPINGPNA